MHGSGLLLSIRSSQWVRTQEGRRVSLWAQCHRYPCWLSDLVLPHTVGCCNGQNLKAYMCQGPKAQDCIAVFRAASCHAPHISPL